MGDELWHSSGGQRMRYLRLAPRQAQSQRARPPLVLIHGLLGYSFSWRHNLEAFAREREVYAVDLLGIGYSDHPLAPQQTKDGFAGDPALSPQRAKSGFAGDPATRSGSADFSLHATAARMLEWLEALGLRNVDLLGTSHGGAVAMMMAALAPQRAKTGLAGAPAFSSQQTKDGLAGNPAVERGQGGDTVVGRLVLAAPANPWSQFGEKRLAFFGSGFGRWLITRSVSRSSKVRRTVRSLALRRMYGDPAKVTAETVDGYDRIMDIPGTIEYALEIVRSWKPDMRELKARLPALSGVPALLLWGSLDRAVAPASGYQLAANFVNARLIVIDGIGHMPYEEAPQQFNWLTLDFLDGSPGLDRRGEKAQSPADKL